MSTQENKDIVRRIYEELWNQKNVDVIDELTAPEYVGHDPMAGEIRGPKALKELAGGYLDAFPDLRFTIDEQIAEDDRVATRWTARGTQRGDLMGIPATGKEATVSGIEIVRLVEGRIVEDHTNWDALGLLQQLGAVPTLTPA